MTTQERASPRAAEPKRSGGMNWLAVVGAILLGALALVLLTPSSRQLVLGQTYDGIPLVIWQAYLTDPREDNGRDPAWEDGLRETLGMTPNWTRWRKLTDRERAEILGSITDDSDPVGRIRIIEHLPSVQAYPKGLSLLRKYVQQGPTWVRRCALGRLAMLTPPLPECLPDLEEWVNDPDPRVAADARELLKLLQARLAAPVKAP